MPQNVSLESEFVETEVLTQNEEKFEKLIAPQAAPRTYEIVYINVICLAYLYAAGVYGLFCLPLASWSTLLFYYIVFRAGFLGILAGAHRLWAHKSYKAKLPLQFILVVLQSMAGQFTIIKWVRDHRMHHKYSDTDADPHNATRGFFYSHMGWLMIKKHDEYRKRVKSLDFSDIDNNPLLRFQYKYSTYVIMIACFILPSIVPVYFWKESFNVSWHVNIVRYLCVTNATSLVNSYTHAFGFKPYDKNIKPTQSFIISAIAMGEGFHNYHHIFPMDYRAAELGNNMLNVTTRFIDFFAWIGWAYDLKTAPEEVVAARSARTGDGTDLWGRTKPEEVKGRKPIRAVGN